MEITGKGIQNAQKTGRERKRALYIKRMQAADVSMKNPLIGFAQPDRTLQCLK